MSLPPERDADAPSAEIARRRMSVGASQPGARQVPNASQIARRRLLLRWAKYALPASALLLLGSIAAWPELDRSMNAARMGMKAAGQVSVQSGHMVGARYRGLDSHNQPFTITADDALQARAPGAPPANGTGGNDGGDRINLRNPIADTLGSGGSWIRISGDKGVYLQHGQQLDLQGNVLLYRDDGIMMTSPVADIDLKRGVVASPDWVHVEGPFGQLDAQSYLMSQKDGLAQFRGPGRLVLNDDKIARTPSPSAASPAGASKATQPLPHPASPTANGAKR
ncbi:LPS export ABC transporter periplasmic protein LptC [Acetobacteraceae bacterium KSS8]|uniref:LPS export ABC transporter periplasmic protein LptC n=1 Tax=Endosaccharibacter trunci TaxID=2812733 RepID=A0ABT1W998_9PROT|nr:LPS export ABC transporter periplasmic protein LptC [Acetobacteraceae bacterium KSS8]